MGAKPCGVSTAILRHGVAQGRAGKQTEVLRGGPASSHCHLKGGGRAQALTRVNPTVYDSVAALCDDPATTVVVFSGSDKVRRA